MVTVMATTVITGIISRSGIKNFIYQMKMDCALPQSIFILYISITISHESYCVHFVRLSALLFPQRIVQMLFW